MRWLVEEEEQLKEEWIEFLNVRKETIEFFDIYLSKKLNKTPKAIFMKRQRLDLTDYKKMYMQTKKYKLLMSKVNKKIWSSLARRNKQSLDKKEKIKLGIIKKPHFPILKGCLSPHWKGGKSRFRGENWKKVREKVIDIFGKVCYNCGKQDCKIDIHHIEPYHISKNNNISNLIPLCVNCHRKAHTGQLATLINEETVLNSLRGDQN